MKNLFYIVKNIKKETGKVPYKPLEFFDIYEKEFNQLKTKKIKLLEIGIGNGKSLLMWKRFFPKGQITGLDIKKKNIKDIKIKIFQGNQTNKNLLRKLHKKRGPFDIIIDDGGHFMLQQIKSFTILFPLLNERGIYVIEDLFTSYWPEFGGKIKKTDTTIEMLKTLIDKLNNYAYYSKRAGKYKQKRKKDFFERYIHSISFYRNICFIHKKQQTKFLTPRNQNV